ETASGEGRTKLTDARNQLLGRLRDQIDRAKALALAGKPDDARKVLAGLRGHFPDSLAPEIEQAERYVNSRSSKSAAEPTKPSEETAPPENGGGVKPAKPDAPKATDDPAARKADELARTGAARTAISKALLELDIAAARAAL